jgi:hypothetical protein
MDFFLCFRKDPPCPDRQIYALEAQLVQSLEMFRRLEAIVSVLSKNFRRSSGNTQNIRERAGIATQDDTLCLRLCA